MCRFTFPDVAWYYTGFGPMYGVWEFRAGVFIRRIVLRWRSGGFQRHDGPELGSLGTFAAWHLCYSLLCFLRRASCYR